MKKLLRKEVVRETTVKAEEQKRVNVPLWAGVALVVAGAGVLVLGSRK